MMQTSFFDAPERRIQLLAAVLQRIPKVELHAHLSGCIRLATIAEILETHELRIPQVARADLLNALVLREPATTYAASFLPWRRVLNRITELDGVAYRLMREVAEDLAADGVVYAELRVSPRVPAQNGTLRHFLEEVDLAAREAHQLHGIDVRVILGITRHNFLHLPLLTQQTEISKILAYAQPFQNSRIVGFDLWGDERAFPPRLFKDVYQTIRMAGYPLTIHAGETGNSIAVREAVETLQCRRIGHGRTAARDSSLCALLKDRDILVEVCLTSNRLTSVEPDLREHAMRTLLTQGVPLTLCADNTLVYQTSLSQEYAHALTLGLIDVDQARDLMEMAATHAFCEPEQRARIRSLIRASFTSAMQARLEHLMSA